MVYRIEFPVVDEGVEVWFIEAHDMDAALHLWRQAVHDEYGTAGDMCSPEPDLIELVCTHEVIREVQV